MAVAKTWNGSSWEDVSYGDIATIGDAKGDLIGFSADNTPVKIDGSGASDGDVLTFDTGESSSVAWQPPMRRARLSVGGAAGLNAAGDYVLAYTGTNPVWVTLGGSYPIVGMWSIGAMDIAVESTDWKVRCVYDIAAGDSRVTYTGLVGANPSGVYGLTGQGIVGGYGTYAEGAYSGTVANQTVGNGSVHKNRHYVGPWLTRATLVASGYQVFAPYLGFVTTVVSVGWWAASALQIETV